MKDFIKFNFKLALIIMMVFLCNSYVSAKTLGQLKSELSAAEKKYENNQSEKQKTEAEISSTKNKINELNRQKVSIQQEITDLNNELEQLAIDIEKMQKEMKVIVNYYQLSNTSSIYLEYAFSATNYTDFIYRLAVAEQLSEYRKNTINKYNNLIDENKNKIEELASKQVSLNNLEKELSNQLVSLGSELSTISDTAIDIKDEIAELKEQVKLYENTYKCDINEELSACVNRVKNAGIPSAAGFYRPVTAGRINADYGYTAYYGAYFHYGIDLGVSHGTPVYSVASGKVVKVYYRASCGGNQVYIAHNINGKTYTTLYAHLSSAAVSEGDIVTHNTIIGYSGGVPSIEYWDSCSTGAHLHFQVSLGAYMTDYFWLSEFQARTINPRTVINFPAWGSYFNGR